LNELVEPHPPNNVSDGIGMFVIEKFVDGEQEDHQQEQADDKCQQDLWQQG